MSTQPRTWFITGSSTGFGRALAEEVLKTGGKVIATARKVEAVQDLAQQYPDRALALPLDVTVPAQIEAAVKQAVAHFGKIDVVVNNAGYGLLAAIEEATDQEIRDQYETNVFGLLNVTRAFLPVLRQQGSGHILQVSSLGGQRAFAGFGIYASTKWAVEGLSEALAMELAPLGIKVTIIEPGAFRTDWAFRSLVRTEPMEAYAASSGMTRAWMRSEDTAAMLSEPVLAARAMMEVVEAANPPLRLPLGPDSLNGIREKLTTQQAELEQWSALSTFTSLTPA